jgi:hypothetical protein
VPGLNKLNSAIGAVQRTEHPVDAVAGIAKDLSNTPGTKSLNNKVTDSLGHVYLEPGTLKEAPVAQ